MAKYEDFIEEIYVESYEDLMNTLQSKTPNFREKYIFRGLGNVEHKLIPSALRKDKNGEYNLNNYIDSKFCIHWRKSPIDCYKEGNITEEEYTSYKDNSYLNLIVDKYENRIEDKTELCTVETNNELKFKRELYALLKFLNLSDRNGLKINANSKVRKLIDENIKYKLEGEEEWPDDDFFEIISLAQHYGVPTEALDWSYDYKVSLYFAVRNILDEENSDCVLWAFNYDFMKNHILPNHRFPYKLHFYRPEYYTNPNLRAQKGLFTFIIYKEYNIDERPFDEILITDLMDNIRTDNFNSEYVGLSGLGAFRIPEKEKLFYKFIIPGKLKHEILKELYIDGYSEDYLFPGYFGVVLGMENKVKLEKYICKLNELAKSNILMEFSQNEIKNMKNTKYIFRKNDFEKDIDKIFIYSKDSKKIYGHFKFNKLIKNPVEFLWDSFKHESTLNEKEYCEYFKECEMGYAIKINDLKMWDYPIPLSDLKMDSEYMLIDKEDEKLNFLLNFTKK